MIKVAHASINSFAHDSWQNDCESLKVPLFRTALELAEANPEQPRIEPDHPTKVLEPELKTARKEIARLQEKNRVLTEENRQLKESAAISDPKRLFDMLESISVKLLAPILEHEATDQGSRDIAIDLRTRPDELRWYVNKGKKSYLEAIEELSPFLDAAKGKLLEKRKRGAAEKDNDHRARLLLEKLKLRGEIRISQAIDIIDGDEGAKPNYTMARRAMKKATEMMPNSAVFIQGSNGGMGSILKRR